MAEVVAAEVLRDVRVGNAGHGVEANRPTLEALVYYPAEQHIIRRPSASTTFSSPRLPDRKKCSRG